MVKLLETKCFMRVIHLEPCPGCGHEVFYLQGVTQAKIFTWSPIISTRKKDSRTLLAIGKHVCLNMEWGSRNSDLEKKSLRTLAGKVHFLRRLLRCLHPTLDVTHLKLFSQSRLLDFWSYVLDPLPWFFLLRKAAAGWLLKNIWIPCSHTDSFFLFEVFPCDLISS